MLKYIRKEINFERVFASANESYCRKGVCSLSKRKKKSRKFSCLVMSTGQVPCTAERNVDFCFLMKQEPLIVEQACSIHLVAHFRLILLDIVNKRWKDKFYQKWFQCNIHIISYKEGNVHRIVYADCIIIIYILINTLKQQQQQQQQQMLVISARRSFEGEMWGE